MKRLIFTLAAAFATVSLSAQTDFDSPLTVSGGNVVAPHSAVTPYATREEAIAGSMAKSTYLVPLTEWTTEPTADGVKYSAKFKYNVKLADRAILLRVEGARGAYEVSVGDRTVGYTTLGAGRAEFDLTKSLQETANIITLSFRNDYAASAIGAATQTPAFYRASIVMPPKVSVSDIVPAVEWNGRTGLLNFGVVMQSYLLNSKVYKIAFELLAPDGAVVAMGEKELTTRMLSRDTVRFFARVDQALPWSAETPDLYRLIVRTEHERRNKEFVSFPIGFRTVALDAERRLLINGSPVEVKSADAEWCGEATASMLEALKAEGYNTVGVKSAPQPDEFYALCDRIGLYVCDQADICSPQADAQRTPSNNPQWKSAYALRNAAMYHSSKLHPSVVAFFVARNAQNGICLYETYLYMKSLESSRPIVYPEADGEWNTDR